MIRRVPMVTGRVSPETSVSAGFAVPQASPVPASSRLGGVQPNSTFCQEVTDDSPPPLPRAILLHLNELGLPEDYASRRRLRPQPEAPDLVTARVLKDGRELQLEPATAAAWAELVAAAARDQITLLLISGFRSVAHQRRIIDQKRAAGQSMAEIMRVNVAPGFSEHHTGRAVDIGTPGCPPLAEEFEQTAAFQWLRCAAGRHGFRLSYPRDNPHGVIYEPWHWFRTEQPVQKGLSLQETR